MNLAQALGIVIPALQDALVVHANGFISRESFNLEDRLGNFYMIGSMGLASSIALVSTSFSASLDILSSVILFSMCFAM